MHDFWNTRRPLLEVLALFALLLGFFSFYGTLQSRIVLDTELRKPDTRAYLGLPELQEEEMEIADGSALLDEALESDSLWASADTLALKPSDIDAADASTWYPIRDSSSHYILLTGDSMSEELMFAFKKYAKFNGHKLKTRIWYSSTTPQWGKSAKLSKFIEQYRPSFIIFTLGANELFIRNIEEREKYIKSIVAEANKYNIPFVWIGPPNWKKDTGINRLIEKNVGSDRFFLSKDLKFERKSDGAHPTRRASAIWADTISRWVMTQSRYKGQILLRDPKLKGPERPYRPQSSDSVTAAREEYTPVAVLTEKNKPSENNSDLSNNPSQPNGKPRTRPAPPPDTPTIKPDSSKRLPPESPPKPKPDSSQEGKPSPSTARPEDFERSNPAADSSRSK